MGKVVDRKTQAINNLFKRTKHQITKTRGSKFTPNLFNRIHFRGVRGNIHQNDIIRTIKIICRMPGSAVTDENDHIFWISSGQLTKEYSHTGSIAIRHYQKETLAVHRINCAVCIPVFTDMMTWNRWSNTFCTPASSRFIDSSKASLVLKHQTDFLAWVLACCLLYGSFYFFEAAIVSSSAFFGCRALGITFRHPGRASNI